MLRSVRDSTFPERCINRLTLNTAIKNKLTVIKQQFPILYDHSLRVMFAAVVLGEHLDLESMELDSLATAALLHDVGLLYTEPDILDQTAELDPGQYRQIRAHPLIGQSFLRSFHEFHSTIARGVLEHHERSDGRGYPRGIFGQDISRVGRILSFTEFGIGIVQQDSVSHMRTVMKGSLEQFDPEVTAVFEKLCQRIAIPDDASCEFSEARRALEALEAVLAGWQEWRKDESSEIALFLEKQLSAVNKALVRSGLYSNINSDPLDLLKDTPDLFCEVHSVLRESVYQVQKALQDANNLWPAVDLDDGQQKLSDWLRTTNTHLSEL